MMRRIQRLGRSLMLPVAVLPAAAVLMGIGHWIDPNGEAGTAIAAFFIKAGGSIIDNLPLLFAVGVAIGLAKDRDGSAALSGLVAYLVATTMLSTNTVAILQGIDVAEVDPSFAKIANAFIGILSGAIAAYLYNRFSHVKLPDFLAFFSGKRLVPIITSVAMLVVSALLFFIWPIIYGALFNFGEMLSELGAAGAGLFGFFNRLLIPTGLHHALNAVFWFDTIGINDIGKFWDGSGVKGVTGMYLAGFFPIMMFGLPAAGLAMYHTAKTKRKKQAASLMIAASFASFFTGITEPLEFAFMFLAPALYVVHAALTGLSLFIAASFQWTAGFTFSAGFVDFFLSSRLPMANNQYMLLVQGLVFGVIYYFLFRFLIVRFNLKTPGREDDDEQVETEETDSTDSRFEALAHNLLDGLGGKENVASLEYCATRLRVDVRDMEKVDQQKIKGTGVLGLNVIGANHIHVIVGTSVQFVADEIDKLR